MPIKQISIFVENKPGRLADITSLVAEKGIDIRALSIFRTAVSTSMPSVFGIMMSSTRAS